MRTIYPQPGHTEAETKALIDSRQFVYAECFTIIPLEGPVMRYTSHEQDVSAVEVAGVNRQWYRSKQVLVTGLRAKSTIGVEVDEQTATFAYGPDEKYQSTISWTQAALLGRLDGATIIRDRFVAPDWGNAYMSADWYGGVRMFSGLVSSIDKAGRSFSDIKVKSYLEKLNVQMPRDLYNPTCRNVWGDAKCGVNQNDFAVLGTIGAGSTRTVLNWTGADANYGLGKLHITNADDVTRVRTILKATSTQIFLVYPLDFDPVTGQEFTAFPGCNRSFTRCGDFHLAPEEHFGGCPFVPVAETAA